MNNCDYLPPGYKRVRELSNELGELMSDPQPGMLSWKLALGETLEELATYCGTEVAEHAAKVRSERVKA